MHFARCNLQYAMCKMQFARCELQKAISKVQYERCNLKDAICNLQFARCNLKNVICKMQCCTIAVCMSCHSSESLEGGGPYSAEVIEDTEDFVYYSGFYSLFSVPTDL